MIRNAASDALTRRCAHCGEPFSPSTEWHRFCSPQCRLQGWVVTKAAEMAGQPDLFSPPEPLPRRARTAKVGLKQQAEVQVWLRRLAPIARELAAKRPDGVTVADVRIEAERRGMEWPAKHRRDFLGALMQAAGLVATDRMRASPIAEQHGRRQVVWSMGMRALKSE